VTKPAEPVDPTVIEITSGNPTDDEVAAVIAVLTSGAEQSAPAPALRVRPESHSRWSSDRRLRDWSSPTAWH